MSKGKVREMLVALKDVLESKDGRVDVFVNNILMSNYADYSRLEVDYNSEDDSYTIHLVVNDLSPVCSVIEECIETLNFYEYDKE